VLEPVNTICRLLRPQPPVRSERATVGLGEPDLLASLGGRLNDIKLTSQLVSETFLAGLNSLRYACMGVAEQGVHTGRNVAAVTAPV